MRPKGPPGANTTHNRRARRGAARFWNWNRERDDDLQQRGVAVEMTTQRLAARRNGEHFELHILAAGGTEAVAVEVKTTLRPRDVKRFEEKLARIREWLRGLRGPPDLRRGGVPGGGRIGGPARSAPGSVRHPGHGQQRQHRERRGLQAPGLPLSRSGSSDECTGRWRADGAAAGVGTGPQEVLPDSAAVMRPSCVFQ